MVNSRGYNIQLWWVKLVLSNSIRGQTWTMFNLNFKKIYFLCLQNIILTVKNQEILFTKKIPSNSSTFLLIKQTIILWNSQKILVGIII